MYNVMVVDDEAIIRRGLKTIIHRQSNRFKVVCEACNGLEALKLIEENYPDVIISDVRMPEMNGLQLAKHVITRFPNIIMVILSGYDDFTYAQQAIKYKVYDYILKPLASDDLLKLLDKIDSELRERLSNIKTKEYLNMRINGNISFLFTLVKKKDLILNIKLVKKREASKTVNEIFSHIKNNKIDLNHVKHFALELFSMVLNETSILDDEARTALNLDINSAKISLRHLNSLNSIEIWMQNCINTLMDYISNSDKNKETKVIEKIKKYIKENYEKEITLNTLAKKFYLNPCYLSDLFKNKTGENFSDYLVKVRIEKSIELLHDERLKICQVSSMVGYSSHNHFNRLFKKITGLTPGEYRKRVT